MGSRPLWQKMIFVRLFYLTQLPKKSPLINTLLHKIKNWPIIWNIVEKLAFKGDYGFVLPLDKIIQINEKIEPGRSIILPSKIVEFFIKKAKYHVIKHNCVCRYSNKCKDYPIELGCIYLGEGALEIDSSRGRVVTKEEALEHTKKCHEAGLIYTIGKFWWDTIAGGIKKPNKFMTICNCCPCCCIEGITRFFPPQIMRGYLKLPGLEVKVTERCIGCGACIKNVCYLDQIHLVNKRAVIGNRCTGCGRCILACPQNAIELKICDEYFFEKAIKRLSTVLDIE